MGKPRTWKIKKWVVFVFLAMVLVVYIGFVEHRGRQKTYAGIEVYVEGVSEVYFVDEKEILLMLENEFEALKPGVELEKISLYELEKKVETHPFVKNADVYADLKGKIMVKIAQHIPLARITRPMAADGYISTEGKVLPTSRNFTPRVMTLEGRGASSILDKGELSPEQSGLLELARFIAGNKFWNAQINGMELLANGEVLLQQQVGKQTIEFGKPTDIEEKFKKIDIYYKEIVPQKGWNAYQRVNVKFKDQIICE